MDPRDVVIKEPCHEDWSAMRTEPGSPRRHCELCAKDVHDLSAMTRAEAELFLTAMRGQDVCISYVRDREGTMTFRAPRQPPDAAFVPVARLQPRGSRPASVARAAVKTAMAGALAACAPHGEPEVLEIDDASESAGMEAAIYDEPRIPEQRPNDQAPDMLEEEPCDGEASETPVRERKRTLGRRPARKKGKMKIAPPPPDEELRTLGWL